MVVFFITPSRKQNVFVNLPVGDSSPLVLIPGHSFLEEMMFSLRSNLRQRHWGKEDGGRATFQVLEIAGASC